MKFIVNPHKIEILKEPVNEKEIDITKCEFEFSEDITDDFVKDAYFTFKGTTYKQIIQDNQCAIPYEVLSEKGQVEIGVVCYKVENDEEIKRYNPSPAYFNTWIGSLKEEYENTEPITPTDKEQIEQMLSNINLSINKEGKITTISFTNTDGETQTETLEDGIGLEFIWQGTSLGVKREDEQNYQYVNLKGEKGEPGAIKFEIVETLPTENIKEDTIYLVPYDVLTVESLPENGLVDTIYIVSSTQKRYVFESGQWIEISSDNKYKEYIYVNGNWERLGSIGIEVDLTDYVKNTDYATESVAGVMKIGGTGRTFLGSNHQILPSILNYSTYSSANDYVFIGKGTLENVLDARIGDIQTLLDNLNNGGGVQ